MKVLVLDGARVGDRLAARVRGLVEKAVAAAGHATELVPLRDRRIGNCAGDFFCWVRTPGVCNTDDDNRAIAASIVNSDLVVYLGPVTFGGYGSVLKRMVDHQIQNIAPQFQAIDGETHHRRRYERYPDLLSIGWLDRPDPDAEAVFARLVARNAINLHAASAVAGVVHATMSDDEIRQAVDGWLRRIAAGGREQAGRVPEPAAMGRSSAGEADVRATAAPRRALLLVGSPRTRSSTSHSLGSYLAGRLAQGGVVTETVHLHTIARSPARIEAMLATLDDADLVVLAFPLYVDQLPAPVIEVLERIAAHRAGRPARTDQALVAIANCGFIEAAHNDTALAICATFARQAGFAWAGGLSLGGGEGLVHGAPLESLGGRARNVTRALDVAADALLRGDPVPADARRLMATPFIPGWLYRLVGGLGWWASARRWGVARSMGRRPYATPADGAGR